MIEWLVSCTIFYHLARDVVPYEQTFPTRELAAAKIAEILDERENGRLHRSAMCVAEPLPWPVRRIRR